MDYRFTLIALLPILVVVGIIVLRMAITFINSLNLPQRTPGRVRSNRYPNVRREFQQIAQLFGGRLIPGPLYELPRVTLEHHLGPIVLEAQYHGAQPAYDLRYYVRIRCPWPDTYFRLDVYPEGLLGSLRKLIGMRDIEVGEPEFDRIYMVSGNDLAAVRKLMTQRVRDLVSLLRGAGRNDDIHLRIVGGELSISKRNIRGDYELLRTFVELSLALHAAALGQPNAGVGIDFLDEGIVRGDAPICQVCGEVIDTPEVQCARCFTPHHRECWTYFGGCSIYGCRGEKCEPTT